MIRKTLVCTFVGLLAVAGAAPSSAATTPSQVGIVSFTGATTASLSLVWPKTTNATSYEVFQSSHEDMSGAVRIGKPTSPTFNATGLVAGKVYCFQVRGKRGSTVGKRSAHTCKPAIRSEGANSGQTYRVLTYNVCSSKCGATWDSVRQAPAQGLIQSQSPDVIAMQEAQQQNSQAAAGSAVRTPAGYTLAVYRSAKMLFYRTDRFTQNDGGFVTMGPVANNKFAVWAELADKTSDQRVIFVDVHTTSGKEDPEARKRFVEIQTLRDAMDINNPDRLPVVYAGDFNSHKNRSNDYLADVFHNDTDYTGGIAYYDAYDLAETLSKPNNNSYNGFKTTPITSKTWGDHVDHVWVDPTTTRILRWALVAKFTGTNYSSPIPSDHNALSIDVQVN